MILRPGLIFFEEQYSLFEAEEKERLGEIERSVDVFEKGRKVEMGVCGRFRRMLGKKKAVVPFDPFAEEAVDAGEEGDGGVEVRAGGGRCVWIRCKSVRKSVRNSWALQVMLLAC